MVLARFPGWEREQAQTPFAQAGGPLKWRQTGGHSPRGAHADWVLPKIKAPMEAIGKMESPRDSAVVLVVEDDPDLQRILELQLKMLGYTPALASDGKEGFERAKEVIPDVIILDLMMPVMDGFQVLKRIKCIDALATTPVIILTASHDEHHRRKGMSHFADAYMTKPYTVEQLRSTLGELLASRPA